MLLEALALAWLSGSAVAALGWPAWLAGLAACFALPFFLRVHRRTTVILALATGVLLSVVSLSAGSWYRSHQPKAAAGDISRLIDRGPVSVRGVVEGDRDERERALLLKVKVDSAGAGSSLEPASGVLLVRTPLSIRYDDGDAIEARGRVIEPGGLNNGDYREYLARQAVFTEMDYPATRLLRHEAGPAWRHRLVLLRERLADGISSVLPEPEASLGAGIALGTRKVIEPGLNQALTTTGTAQIIVASGYNITVVAVLVLGALSWLVGRRFAAIATLLGIWGYAIFVGLYPSVVRAAVMGVIVVLAAMAGRPHAASRSLIIASAIMVAINPLALRDLSFLLSVSGTAGLILLASPLAAGISRIFRVSDEGSSAIAKGLVLSSSTTLAALIASLPLSMATFGRFSLAALPANVLLFPAVPAIMAASAATAAAGAIWHPLGQLLAPIAYVLLAFMVFVVRLFARIPGAEISVPWFGGSWAIALYTIAASILASTSLVAPERLDRIQRAASEWLRPMRERRVEPDNQSNMASGVQGLGSLGYRWLALPLAGLLVVVIATMTPVFATGNTSLTVTFLDVGDGSAILIQSGSQRVLVDAGPAGDSTVRALDRVLPPWKRSLNLLVLSDGAAGHSGGLPSVLKRYEVGGLIDASGSNKEENRESALAGREAMVDGKTLILGSSAATSVQLGEALLTIVPPSDAASSQQGSVTLQLAGRHFILAGSDSAPAELMTIGRRSARGRPGEARIMVVETTGAAVGKAASLQKSASDALIYRTRENGDITIDVSERELNVHVARGPQQGIGAFTAGR